MATITNQDNNTQEVIVKLRCQIMASAFQSSQYLREGPFLNPSFPSDKRSFPKLPSHSLADQNTSNVNSVIAEFRGWQKPYQEWCNWAERLRPIHEATWKKAGIFEAIKSAFFRIHQDVGIMLSLAEKWHNDSKSFIFRWGEASVTLEDVCVLGGFSVTGDSVSISIPSDMGHVQQRLVAARKVICKTLVKKCTYNLWLKHFTDEGNGTGDVEHVAFLVFWLSKFVFPKLKDGVRKDVHGIAMKLASGIRIALAPAILASIYSDLRRLKESLSKSDPIENEKIELWSLMHLVQAWVWERFPKMGLKPNTIQAGEPRLARWHNFEGVRHYAPGEMMDVAKYDFQWRPYCMVVNNWTFNEFYRTDGEWVEIKRGNGQELEPFAMFIRHSELVGFEGNIEEYMPYRVAMQFGMNQDVPGLVARFNESAECAKAHYNRPWDQKIYIPSRHLKGDVTLRYVIWFNLPRLDPVKSGPSSSQPSPNDENNGKSKKMKLVLR